MGFHMLLSAFSGALQGFTDLLIGYGVLLDPKP